MADVPRGGVAGTTEARPEPAATGFWPYGWWRIVDLRIGIVPLPIFVLLVALIAGFVLTGKVPSDILMGIVLLSMGGFACAELGKRLPVLRHVGAAAIFATFIPSFMAFHHLLPASVLDSVTQFTKESNFLYLFISSIIVGSILGMDRHVLIQAFSRSSCRSPWARWSPARSAPWSAPCWGSAPITPSTSSSCRSWPAASAKARSRSRSAIRPS